MYIHTYICISYTYSDMYIYILCEYIVHTYIHTYIHTYYTYVYNHIFKKRNIYIYVNTVYSINMYIHVDNVFKNEHEYTVHECTLYKDIM